MVINGIELGKLKSSVAEHINAAFGKASLKGYFITGTFKYSCEEILEYDKKHGTKFYKKLDAYTKGQGFVMLPLFAGYGEKA